MFSDHSFGKNSLHAAVKLIERHSVAVHAAKVSFVSVLDSEVKGGFSFARFAKPYRALGWTHDETGLALIDYVVACAKAAAELVPAGRERLLAVAAQLEPVIDAAHRELAPRFVPSNGEVGRMAAPLTQEEERVVKEHNARSIDEMSLEEMSDSIVLNDALIEHNYAAVRSILAEIRRRKLGPSTDKSR